jgi:hypothetical protein
MDELCAAVAEIARMIRVASKDKQRTIRVVCMTVVFGATMVGVAAGLALAIGRL